MVRQILAYRRAERWAPLDENVALGDEADVGTVVDACVTPPFLAHRRVVRCEMPDLLTQEGDPFP